MPTKIETANTATMRLQQAAYMAIEPAIAAANVDPRTPNCRDWAKNAAGQITGIRAIHVPVPLAPYRLHSCSLQDEQQAQNNHVATIVVLSKDKVPVHPPLWYAWAFPDLNGQDSPNRPGNPNGQFDMSSKYPYGGVPPLYYYVGDEEGRQLSDGIACGGLPDGRHVCLDLVFIERDVVEVEPEPEPIVTGDYADVVYYLRRLSEAQESMLAWFKR